MSTIHDHDESVDPQLRELLSQLRPTPPRDPEAAARTKSRFMAELDELFTTQHQPYRSPVTGWQSIIHTLKESFIMLNLAQRTLLTTLIVIAVFFIGGYSMTAAAQSALPGDALYNVKTGLEQAQLSIKTDSGVQAELYVEYAGRRLAEIEKLIEAGRYEEVNAVAVEFQASVQKALQAVQALAATDPARAAELASQIANKLAAYVQSLTKLMASVPASVQSSLQSAASSAQGALDNQNSNDNGNANDNANGNGDDNANGNGDDNANGNGDDNANGNGDDNANGNGDDNANGNGDDNANGNGDDNANGNGDDNANANGDDNANGNGDDDNGNGGDDNGNGSDDNGNGGDDNGGGGGSGDDNGNGESSAASSALFSNLLALALNYFLI